MLLVISFHLECPIFFFGHGPRIKPFYPESRNSFRFEAGVPRGTPENLRPEKYFQVFSCLEKIMHSQPLLENEFFEASYL